VLNRPVAIPSPVIGAIDLAFEVVSKKSGKAYFLHSKEVTLNGGRQQTIYYFAGDVRDNALDGIPTGYVVTENTRTGLPMLKKG